MHVVIINGSPRIKKNSNTGKIISAFTRGLGRTGATFEVFALSDRSVWDEARRAFLNNDKIIIAHPLLWSVFPLCCSNFLSLCLKNVRNQQNCRSSYRVASMRAHR